MILAKNKQEHHPQQTPMLLVLPRRLKSNALLMLAVLRQAVRHIVTTEIRFHVSLGRQTTAIPYHHLLSLLEVHIDARRLVCVVASQHLRRCPLSVAFTMLTPIRKPRQLLLIVSTPYLPLPPPQGFPSLHITRSKFFPPHLALLLASLAISDWFEMHPIAYVTRMV